MTISSPTSNKNARETADRIRLVTLDLDDTLWAITPLIERAEARLHAWLAEQCPASAEHFLPARLRACRREVETLHPEHAGDISELRRLSIRLALKQGGEDEVLADGAFDVFWAARNEIDCFDDVLPALERLKSRFIVAAVTNGNACLERAGLSRFFDFSISARDAGCTKPSRQIFHLACQRAGVRPDETLHAGDDIECDVRGALAAGLHAAWINRDGQTRLLAPPAITLTSLSALADYLSPAE